MAGINEEELKGRHGGSSGVVTKGSEWKGKSGPEYSFPTMNKPGDRGQTGDGLKSGDYDNASEEGDGEYVKGSSKSESRCRACSESREKIRFLENELARYEDIVQEQHDIIRESDEARERESLARYRAEAIARNPELAVIESTLMRCESVQELEQQIGSCLSLVETVQSSYSPPAQQQTRVLMERTIERPRNGISSHGVDAAPPGLLNESSAPFADGPRSTIGGGNVASRLAAHRRRRSR